MTQVNTTLSDAMVQSIADLSKKANDEVRISEGGRIFSTKKFEEVLVNRVDGPPQLYLSSLESLLAFMEQEKGFAEKDGEPRLVVIESVGQVGLYSPITGWPHPTRHKYAVAVAPDLAETGTDGETDRMRIEQFLIFLRSKFVPTPHLDRLLEVLGNASWEAGIAQADDGVSQTVTTRAGTVLPTVEAIPKYLSLRPYRTFRDVAQPESLFILRASGNLATGVSAYLVEADGGAWRLEAMRSIKAWFKEREIEAVG